MKTGKHYNVVFTYIPIFLGLLLIAISIINTYSDEHNVLEIVSGVLLIIIPYIYTSIPIIQERYKENNTITNRLSNNTFTDRQIDLNNILDLLSKHKIIQLTGNDRQCGKTWLAHKLIDCIKHPRDLDSKRSLVLKKHIKKAYYIDMENKTDAEINCFFENNIVTNKTLIIVDHIKKIEYIFTKQDIYGFTLIFITSNKIDTKGTVYYISKFEIDNIRTLQENINRNYNNIELLNSNEIDILYDITYGNIGKMHFLLERQEYVIWIKQLSLNLKTQYDRDLNIIQLELFAGKYTMARASLDDFKQRYEVELLNNNDLFYKYYKMKADCEHLLNNYREAVDILSLLRKNELETFNDNKNLDALEAHFYKHLWDSNRALVILQSIEPFDITGLTDSLGILVAKYFVDDLIVPNRNINSLCAFMNTFEECKNSLHPKSSKDIYKIMRNESIYLYYKNKNTKKEILRPINSVINKYQSENNRLLANAYFIRAELNRLFRNYKNALLDYNRCLTVTDDNNIIIQVNIMKYYLASIKNINIFKYDSHLTKDEIYKLCKDKNKYGMLLIRRINSIELGDPQKEHIIRCFEHRIMTIL